MLGKYERELSGPANRASSFLSESIDVIQTVAHFNYQDIVIATFRNRNALTKRSTLSSFWGSFGFALTEGVMFEEEAIMYFAAGSAIINGDSSTPDAWGAFSAVLCAVSGEAPGLSFSKKRLIMIDPIVPLCGCIAHVCG